MVTYREFLVRHREVDPARVTFVVLHKAGAARGDMNVAFIHLLSKMSREVDMKLQRLSSCIKILL